MRYDPARQELVLKIVYYGPGMSGKTTTLQAIHRSIPEAQRSALLTLDTHSERTIQFDFQAVELGAIQGHAVRLELFTVPGQSYYAATRKQILDNADGVLFVADSRREALDENVESMNEMLANLRLINAKRSLEGFPVVLQFNKQDLPTALPANQLRLLMNVGNWPTYSSVATEGTGVMEPWLALARVLAEGLAEVEVPALATPAPSSWLITCFRCQKMMEMSPRRLSLVQDCPACGAPFVVSDADRGLTEPPRHTPSKPVPIIGDSTPQRMPLLKSEGSPLRNAILAQELTPQRQIQSVEPTPDRPADQLELPVIDMEAALERRLPGSVQGDPSPLPGFLVVAVLDESPMGRRFRLRETASGVSTRALILHPGLMGDSALVEGIAPWMRLVQQVENKSLLRPIELRLVPEVGQVQFAIDPTDHESLADVLQRRRVLAPPHAISIIRQLAQVLHNAAQVGLVHGFLRPDVVLLAANGKVLLDEMGVPHPPRWLVKECQSVSAGAEYYLAPEYLTEGLRIDARSDIFLLGCLLFRMLTGEGLVTGYNGHEALHKLISSGPRLLRDVQSDISRDLSNLHQRMVAVDRRERLASHEELIQLLDRFGGGAQAQALSLTRVIERPPSGQWSELPGMARSVKLPPPPASSAAMFPTIPHRKATAASTATRTTARFDRTPLTFPPPPEPLAERLRVVPDQGFRGLLLVIGAVVVVAVVVILLLRFFAHQ